MGNPITYGTDFPTLIWEGRQLTSIKYKIFYFSFAYNDQGLRTQKNALGYTFDYVWDGDTLVSQQWSNNLFVFLYDENGSPIGLQYRTIDMDEGDFYTYFFEKNLFGDILAIYNENGTKICSYVYDAWGNSTRTIHVTTGADYTVALQNPFRYRGYYYDAETGWYYLQSRYYDPNTGRFLNADGYVNANGDLIGFNMYAYCGNNPVMYTDPTGQWGWKTVGLLVAGIALSAVIATFVATTAGAGLALLGVAEATVGTLVKAGIVAGVLAGTKETVAQLIQSEGEQVTFSEISNVAQVETLNGMADKAFLTSGLGISDFYAEHEFLWDVTKTTTKITLEHVFNSTDNDSANSFREYSIDLFENLFIPTVRKILETAIKTPG